MLDSPVRWISVDHPAIAQDKQPSIREQQPLTDRQEITDVLVIGGGTAGFGAAIAAARAGRDVVLLEATSKVGGVMAFCPGMPWGGA